MMRNLAIALISVLMSVSVVSVLGQEKPKTETQSKSETKPVSSPDNAKGKTSPAKDTKDKEETETDASALRQRGLYLLRQAGDDASSLSDAQAAAQIQSKAADLLWDYDREMARKYFENAFEIAVRFYRDKPGIQPDKKHPYMTTRGDARMEVVTLAGRRDSELGRKFTEQYLEEKKREAQDTTLQNKTALDGTKRLYGNIDPAANDLIRTSFSLLESDPKAAVDLAMRAFSTGVPNNAPSFLATLAGRDRATADKIFGFSLIRIASDESVPPGQLLLLSAYPFGEGTVWVTDGGGSSSWGFGPPKNFTVEPAQIQQFFSASVAVLTRIAALNPAVSADAASRIGAGLFMARILQPKINQFQPGLAEEWLTLTNRLETASSEDTRSGVDSTIKSIERQNNPASNAASGNHISDLLNQAENATNAAAKDGYYQLAALEVDRGGETDRALIIADKISDREYRDKTKSWIYFEAATRAIKDKRYDEARRYASLVNVVDQCSYLYIQVAIAALKDKDQARATEMLDESLRKTSSADDSMEKLRALLGIANVYSTFDTVRGFEVAAEAVRTANKVPDYNSEQNFLIRDIMSPGRSGTSSASGVENFEIGRTLTVLGRSDFDRSLLLAQSLESKPMRLTSIIAVAASAIEKKNK